jgi:hypothetical protein
MTQGDKNKIDTINTRFLGAYNPVTDTPTLPTLPDAGVLNGDWYIVDAAGVCTAAPATGVNGVSMNVNDQVRASDTLWYHFPATPNVILRAVVDANNVAEAQLPTLVPLAVKGASGQSTRLFEARDNADQVLAYITSGGRIVAVAPNAVGQVLVNPALPSQISPQGAGSGLNADLLDGIEAAGFALVGHTHIGQVGTDWLIDGAVRPGKVYMGSVTGPASEPWVITLTEDAMIYTVFEAVTNTVRLVQPSSRRNLAIFNTTGHDIDILRDSDGAVIRADVPSRYRAEISNEGADNWLFLGNVAMEGHTHS